MQSVAALPIEFLDSSERTIPAFLTSARLHASPSPGPSAGERGMDQHRNFTFELFGMVFVAALLVAIGASLVEPMSKRLAAFASQSIASDPACAGALSSNAALVCMLSRASSAHR